MLKFVSLPKKCEGNGLAAHVSIEKQFKFLKQLSHFKNVSSSE